jgi:hypothetical protein
VPTQLVPLEEGNRHDVPSRRRQQPIAQAGVAEWLTRVSGEVERAVELDGNAPVKERKIYGRKPIRRGVLLLVGDAQPVQALSDLSVPPRHSCIRQTLSMRSLCSLKYHFRQ